MISDCGLNEIEYESGAYDKCLVCQALGTACDGPNILAMSPKRRAIWGQALKRRRNYTNAYIAERTGLSKTTVDKFFQGRIDDVKISTVEAIFQILIGSWGQHPCAMAAQEDTVFAHTENHKNFLQDKNAHMQKQLNFYEGQLEYMRQLLDERGDYLRMKDGYIRHLIQLLAELMPESDLKALLAGMNYEAF